MAIGQVRETLDDLMKFDGKAELIGGRLVPLMATGPWPNEVAGNIYEHLKSYCRETKSGRAFTDNIGFTVSELASGRESFSPDASFFSGTLPPKSMKLIAGPPTFAVEVRSQEEYGPSAEIEMAVKRAEYFEAGAKIVWDVDPKAETIAVYREPSDEPVEIFRRGEQATAEPWVPGWVMAVDDVFREQN